MQKQHPGPALTTMVSCAPLRPRGKGGGMVRRKKKKGRRVCHSGLAMRVVRFTHISKSHLQYVQDLNNSFLL